jgi:hypothetical protein
VAIDRPGFGLVHDDYDIASVVHNYDVASVVHYYDAGYHDIHSSPDDNQYHNSHHDNYSTRGDNQQHRSRDDRNHDPVHDRWH